MKKLGHNRKQMMKEKNQLLTSKTVCDRGDTLTVIQTSYIVEESKAIITLQSFHSEGAQCSSILIHPETARELAIILNGIVAEHDKYQKTLEKEE